MYKLERNSPIKNLSHNIETFFPQTRWAGNTFLVSLVLGGIAVITVNHPSLQAHFQEVVGGTNCLFAVSTLGTLAWTIKNFKQEKVRWMELGKQIEKEKRRRLREEQAQMSQFLTPDQLMMREFTAGDKLIPIQLFQDSQEGTSGGRQEDMGFSKVLQFPGR